MSTRTLMTLGLLVVLGSMRAAWAQPPTQPTTGPLVRPVVTADTPTWDDANRHIRIVASYDGRRIRGLKASLGEGSARSYLSQRRDVVVVILNNAKEVVREFNLSDPLELRVREHPPTRRSDILVLGIREPAARPSVSRPPLVQSGENAGSAESTVRQRETQFELFVPRIEGAKWLEFHKGDAKGALLGRVDLTEAQ